jgi:FkbM family methyltransferase
MTGGLRWTARWVARHRRNRLLRQLAAVSRRYLAWYGNLNYDTATNGEQRVLQRLTAFAPQRLFDAGANVGEWSLAAARLCPTARIDAFEISPQTFSTLKTATGHEPRIHAHPIGLGDASGIVHLRHYPDAPALTTSSAYPHPLPFTEVDGRVGVGDQLAAELGAVHIDLLKIDVEGMEEAVLKGFDGLLRRRAIDLIQFEYGRVNILNGFLLHRAERFFVERGYVMGKIYPDGVDFRPVELDDEDFLGPNFLACNVDRVDLIKAMSEG